MIFKRAKFNPVKDIQEVDQFGFIDLVKAFQNGYVEGDSDIRTDSYNNIEEPASIMGKPSDVFDALRMQDKMISSIKEVAAKQSASPTN